MKKILIVAGSLFLMMLLDFRVFACSWRGALANQETKEIKNYAVLYDDATIIEAKDFFICVLSLTVIDTPTLGKTDWGVIKCSFSDNLSGKTFGTVATVPLNRKSKTYTMESSVVNIER